MKPTGYQRPEVQEAIRKSIAQKIANGQAAFFADKAKKIDVEKEAKAMQGVKYD